MTYGDMYLQALQSANPKLFKWARQIEQCEQQGRNTASDNWSIGDENAHIGPYNRRLGENLDFEKTNILNC